jgi:hypothetical protein
VAAKRTPVNGNTLFRHFVVARRGNDPALKCVTSVGAAEFMLRCG